MSGTGQPVRMIAADRLLLVDRTGAGLHLWIEGEDFWAHPAELADRLFRDGLARYPDPPTPASKPGGGE